MEGNGKGNERNRNTLATEAANEIPLNTGGRLLQLPRSVAFEQKAALASEAVVTVTQSWPGRQ